MLGKEELSQGDTPSAQLGLKRADFVILYPNGISPVLYIGRGDAFTRLSSQLKRWLNQVDGFGKDVGLEARVCRPRRKGLADLFKYVEADLINSFI